MARDSVDIDLKELKALLYDWSTNDASSMSVAITDAVHVYNITGAPHYSINFTLHASTYYWDGTGFRQSALDIMNKIAARNSPGDLYKVPRHV